jgi:N-acyl-D-aspartate/D-glutamate deacylase
MQSKQFMPLFHLLLFNFLLASFQPAKTLLITNVWLLDGTGRNAYRGAVRIKDNTIQEVGNLQSTSTDDVIDGGGKMLTPGFIDTHSHHLQHLRSTPEGLALVNQGITSIVIGQDGNSLPMDSLESFFNQKKVAVNLASYTGHTSLREEVLGENNLLRAASEEEIRKMKKILAQEMSKGALGLSTGLEYEAAFYSSKQEILELAEETARWKGRYISHIRSEDVTLNDALEEIIQIGRKTGIPVQISHIKIGNRDDWGRSKKILEQLDQARKEGVQITADVYPYTFWNSTLRVLFPDRKYDHLESARLAVTKLCDPTASVLLHYLPHPSYENKTLEAIAVERKEEAAQTLIWLIKTAEDFNKKNPDYSGTLEAIAGKAMSDADLENFLVWKEANICSDGNAAGHPRGYGAFTRVLGKYVREKKLMSWEQAIHKMTGLAAAHLGWKDRGLIAPGQKADLVLFDPETVEDKASLQNHQAMSAGILGVWVNGQKVYENGKATGNFPGILIKASH